MTSLNAKTNKTKLTRKHGKEPRDGKELWYEVNLLQMSGEHRIMECDELRELEKVLSDHCRVVFQEEVVQILRNESRQAGIRSC